MHFLFHFHHSPLFMNFPFLIPTRGGGGSVKLSPLGFKTLRDEYSKVKLDFLR